jgi:hypothetical protein
MNRRQFLQSLLALGAAIAVPINLASATTTEVDTAWKTVKDAWGLFEVNDYGTLSYANFEEPVTRRDAYMLDLSDFDADEIDRHYSLREGVKNLYRDQLIDTAGDTPDYASIDQQVEDSWLRWVKKATRRDQDNIDYVIEEWLDAEPDLCNEWENFYKTGNAQGAAYDHFLSEDPEIMDALCIVIIEEDCPGSSYFAAELHMLPKEANEIAEARGWQIRFVTEG